MFTAPSCTTSACGARSSGASAILSLSLTSLLGAVLLFYSIAGKNATLAALLEITYPLFVALFAWLLFREVHINASVVLGALLVFAGTALIIWQNP